MRMQPHGILFPSLFGILLFASIVPQPKSIVSPTGVAKGDYYEKKIHPILARYCLGCHSSLLKKGGLDLARFEIGRAHV